MTSKQKLTQKRLRKLFWYSAKTGFFTRKTTKGGRLKGSIAGYKNDEGYIRLEIDKKTHSAHRLSFLYIKGYFPENNIDHIDRIPWNNAWNNLREVSHICNMRNRGKRSDNKSGIIGVYNRNGKWVAYMRVNKEPISLGTYIKKIDAANARYCGELQYDFKDCNNTSSALNYIRNYNNGVSVKNV